MFMEIRRAAVILREYEQRPFDEAETLIGLPKSKISRICMPAHEEAGEGATTQQ